MAKKDKKEQILRMAQQKGVKFIRLWFTDILGMLKSFAITIEELEGALNEGMGFDGSSIEGFARIDESDMVAIPDPDTFAILPWRPQDKNLVARMFCDIVTPDGKPYMGDPRHILKLNLANAKAMGYTFYVGPELEYFYFKASDNPQPLDQGGYFDLTPLDVASDLRRDTVLALEEMSIGVEYSHHEVAPSQHEIDLRYSGALTMADNAMTYRLVVKEVAVQKGVYATFMPKPVFGENGSGMHTHQSLFKDNKNVFFDKKAKDHLSHAARCYIAGLLRHAPEFTLVTNQWVNSYKRLVPGYEAPAYISWAVRNRSDMIRVPAYKPGKEKATRVELRSPDPACNPYLAFSVMLAAGLEGMKHDYKLEDPVEENIYIMSEEERRRRKIKTLPGNLYEAIELAEKSEFLKKALGDHVFHSLISNKKIEWDSYRSQVTDYEIKRYLPRL
ncbi:MAG: glutamine synthetase [Candidatus Omnitrophica bacterium CG1_02_49_10]|nr:MAG: glutamine synthetase [Candidatus Omnitrophica bacterium CG1_02_49_10]